MFDYGKEIIRGYYNTVLFPASTTFLLFSFKGSKILNGGSEAQDTNQSQHNGENAEERKDRHEAGSKKKTCGEERELEKPADDSAFENK